MIALSTQGVIGAGEGGEAGLLEGLGSPVDRVVKEEETSAPRTGECLAFRASGHLPVGS